MASSSERRGNYIKTLFAKLIKEELVVTEEVAAALRAVKTGKVMVCLVDVIDEAVRVYVVVKRLLRPGSRRAAVLAAIVGHDEWAKSPGRLVMAMALPVRLEVLRHGEGRSDLTQSSQDQMRAVLTPGSVFRMLDGDRLLGFCRTLQVGQEVFHVPATEEDWKKKDGMTVMGRLVNSGADEY